MKISNLTPPGHTGQSGAATRTEGKPASTESTSSTDPGAVSHVSPAWQNEQQDIDSTRVEALRQAIADGRLEFRAERVADRLIESLQEQQGSLDS